MSTLTFDTLKYSNTLKEGGVPAVQAEAQANALAEALAVNLRELATKPDMDLALAPLKTDIAVLKADATTFKWLLGFLVAGMLSLMAGMLALVLKAFFP
ncbi:MAG: DUF1640 domain-containing protein [Candidatus Moranbacteria bacterium]|nr:DUF1640 domain-containing protein [Candidatus Moranbacteria bacterium]